MCIKEVLGPPARRFPPFRFLSNEISRSPRVPDNTRLADIDHVQALCWVSLFIHTACALCCLLAGCGGHILAGGRHIFLGRNLLRFSTATSAGTRQMNPCVMFVSLCFGLGRGRRSHRLQTRHLANMHMY